MKVDPKEAAAPPCQLPVAPLGVGMQLNPALGSVFPFHDQDFDVLEILFDVYMGALDGPRQVSPHAATDLRALTAKFPIIGHSNYGGDFGFDALDSTSAVRRHVPLAQQFGAHWVSNHCFYSDQSWSDVWSSPVQFSPAEVTRLAPRAAALQACYGVPLGHENAAYYRRCPGSTMPEEEFLAALVDQSETFLHLDLHNLYTNDVNHGPSGYSLSRFLDTIPLERVISIHLAGGRWLDDFYHDLHDTQVPDPVWDLLDTVLARAHPAAVILEYENSSLFVDGTEADADRTVDLILEDLERARRAWDKAFGEGTRRTSRQTLSS